MRNLRLIPLRKKGWYHNIAIGGSDSWTLFGRNWKSPVMDPLGHRDLWREGLSMLCQHLGWQAREPLAGRTVLDIGPAEGLFSLMAIEGGASHVLAVSPRTRLTARFRTLVDLRGLTDKITLVEGYFPDSGSELPSEVDLVLVLGVIYHAQNCETFIQPILHSRRPIFFEFMHGLVEDSNFDAERHNDSMDAFFSKSWLENRVASAGYDLLHCRVYNDRCRRQGFLTPHARTDGWTRSAFVAIPT